jgi:hypothetical protein
MARVTYPPDLVRTLARIRAQLCRVPAGHMRRAINFEFVVIAAEAAALDATGWAPPMLTTPEDTLRDADVDDARQANYQRRLSRLLAGTATA